MSLTPDPETPPERSSDSDSGRLPSVLQTVAALQRAVGVLTVEEFRIEDFRFERDSRLGREALFLMTNNEWGRRTTELIDVGRSRQVDTEIVVDVDPASLNHEALRPGEPLVWLPILALPVERPNPSRRGGRRAGEHGAGPDAAPDPVTSLEVTGPDGDRVTRVPQAEVQHWLAAALAEVLLHRIPRLPGGGPHADRRDQVVALAAAIRRLLPREASPRIPAPDGNARRSGGAATGDEPQVRRVEGRLREAGNTLLATFEHDRDQYRPVLESRLMEIVEALLGTVLVVVAVDRTQPPTSFTVRLPSRRLVRRDRFPAMPVRLRPQARVRVNLLTATASADRLVRLALPVGVTWRSGASADTGGPDIDRPDVARVEVLPPPPLDQLRALARQLTRTPDAPLDWVDRRLADLAVDKMAAARECLQHYQVPGLPGVDAEHATELLAGRLDRLGLALADVARRDTVPDDVSVARRQELVDCWQAGAWMPQRLHRRLIVNATSPDVVHLRAAAIEDFTQRAEPTAAAVDVDVRLQDSRVLDTARDTSGLNLLLLAFVFVLLFLHRNRPIADLHLDALAAVLTLFPAVQAGRVERPDSSTLPGLLSRPGYWLSLVSAVPAILLAAVLAVLSPGESAVRPAAVAAAVQAGLYLLILRPGGLRRGRRARAPSLTLSTDHAPDHERFDVLRSTWCRTLAAEALNLGRPAHAIVVLGSERPGALVELLEASQGSSNGVGAPANLLAVFRGGVAGMAMTLLVFRDEPAARWQTRDRALVRHVLLDPGRLSPAEPPEWIIEVLVGMPSAAADTVELARHPLVHLVNAAGANNFRVMFVQLPATPPRRAAPGRQWMRMRVGVPYRRYDTLSGMRRFLYAVHELRSGARGGGECITLVQIVPEVATLDATQTAPEEAFDPPARVTPGLRPVVDREVDVRPLDPGSVWRPFAFCANARAGLIADIMRMLSQRRGSLRLASATSAVVHGMSATFLLCRDSEAAEPDGGRLGALIAQDMAATDQLEVPIDGRSWASPLLVLPDAGPRPLLRLQIRTADRPGMLREVLGWLAETLHRVGSQMGIRAESLDVWAALIRVVDGHTLQGRLTVRLPSDAGAARAWGTIDWSAVDWTAGARAAVVTAGALAPPDAAAPPTLMLDGPSARLDDGSVVTIDLVRTS